MVRKKKGNSQLMGNQNHARPIQVQSAQADAFARQQMAKAQEQAVVQQFVAGTTQELYAAAYGTGSTRSTDNETAKETARDCGRLAKILAEQVFGITFQDPPPAPEKTQPE